MNPPDLTQVAQPTNDLQYVVYAMGLVMIVQILGPRIMEFLSGRKKLNSSEGNDDPKIATMEQQVADITGDVTDIKGGMEGMRQMQVELLAQFRQMRDDQQQALIRVHERIDKHLDGHPSQPKG